MDINILVDFNSALWHTGIVLPYEREILVGFNLGNCEEDHQSYKTDAITELHVHSTLWSHNYNNACNVRGKSHTLTLW